MGSENDDYYKEKKRIAIAIASEHFKKTIIEELKALEIGKTYIFEAEAKDGVSKTDIYREIKSLINSDPRVCEINTKSFRHNIKEKNNSYVLEIKATEN